jgi:hypothetical protein
LYTGRKCRCSRRIHTALTGAANKPGIAGGSVEAHLSFLIGDILCNDGDEAEQVRRDGALLRRDILFAIGSSSESELAGLSIDPMISTIRSVK